MKFIFNLIALLPIDSNVFIMHARFMYTHVCSADAWLEGESGGVIA